MKSFTYVITDEVGIHARPAGVLAKEAKVLDSKVFLEANGKKAEATRLLAVMGMGVKKGTEITVTVEGGDEETAAEKLEAFFKANL
ncbi:HPr family phosphocarrier protein [Lacrimispora sp. NSJ-141]|uniref:HPr family phosphocarrier protein n=1 Tax=Lientehia hominis TaxID=2897778 RepID=A0AAP2W9N5_9FIRM|nr:HPr family phosphocarrier protein [Lientehia hominis]MCD2493570.1 HPr family phosphocarrier protein [Lientehia hominis]